MLPAISAFYSYILAHRSEIGAFLLVALPTLITGLSEYPKASGIVPTLRMILNLLSLVTHSDSPGTFKAPLTLSKPPDDAPIPIRRGYSRTPVLMVMVLVLGTACALFGPTFKQDELDCGNAALHEAADKILPDVTLMLADPNVAIEKGLADLTLTFGDAVLCAVAVAVRDFEAHQSHTPIDGGAGATGELTEASIYSVDLAISRGHKYLADKKTPVLP